MKMRMKPWIKHFKFVLTYSYKILVRSMIKQHKNIAKDKSKCQCICKYSTYFIHIAKIWVEYSRYVAKACFAKDRIRRVDKIHFPVLYANLIYFYLYMILPRVQILYSTLALFLIIHINWSIIQIRLRME